MATVFLAHDAKHDRPVALKVLHPELAAALGGDRFQREVKLAARLQHPHILSVHDSGESAGHLWFTMPYVEGESLRDRLDRERQLPVDDALRIGRDAAAALQYAHDHGVAHRDIKPENLLLTKDGHVLVADFGIARAIAGEEERLTGTGLSIGTPAYMSPEQAAGDRDVGSRSDIYSLGCVLYEMLAGEPPFTGPTAQAIIAQRLRGEVPLVRARRPSASEAVEQAIARAMAPVPADRWASAAELAHALEPAAPVAAAPPARRPPHRRFSPALAMLLIGFALGLGVLFAWRRSHPGESAPDGVRLIAVLPFENLGGKDDEHFAEGITDEVRGKLAGLEGLGVIAEGSSREYTRSSKPLAEIASELGVDYLLVAKVRWAMDADGTRRVRVSPELIRVSDGTATVSWQMPFDAALTDVFAVQSSIAGQVAGALDVALGSAEREQLEDRPTQNLAAYDAYLRGEAITGSDPASVRRAIGHYEKAVELDPGFIKAWGGLAGARSLLFNNSVPDPELRTAARTAADRTLALDPEGPSGHAALARYYLHVERDPARALPEITAALRAAPHDAALLTDASSADRATGDFEAALAHAREAQRSDPRSVRVASSLQITLLWLRRYPEALQASDAALLLSPGDLSISQDKAMVYVAQGDLAAAREVIREVSPAVSPEELAAFFGVYWDMYWVLDDQGQQLLASLGPEHFDNDAISRALVMMQLADFRGDPERARLYADSGLAANRRLLRETPDPQRMVLAGLQLAYLGRYDEAIRMGREAIALNPLESHGQTGPYFQHQMVRIYMEAGRAEQALDLLEPLLRVPYYLSPGWLRIDPTFAPLRGNARFERLIRGA
jgi:serine/threonine-protein kinase